MLVTDRNHTDAALASTRRRRKSWNTPRWHRLSTLQLAVVALATVAPAVIFGALLLGAAGVLSADTVHDVALAAGEDPGMLTFGAMFLASPMQWWTGRSQLRVRKYLGIVFFALAVSNGAMFLWHDGASDLVREPMLIAGTVAVAFATPLFLTSSRASQRLMGMRRWRLLHKLTYVVAVALLVHVLLVPEPGPGMLMILAGFVARIPAVRRQIENRQAA